MNKLNIYFQYTSTQYDCLRTGRQEFDSRQEKVLLSYSSRLKTGSAAHPDSYPMDKMTLFPGDKAVVA